MADLKENAAGAVRDGKGFAPLGNTKGRGGPAPTVAEARVAGEEDENQDAGPGRRLWYVVRTKAQSENLACAVLKSQGFELFSPRVQKPCPKSRLAHVPLFPGYLFVRCAWSGRRWPSLAQVPGVSGWVSFGGVVPSVPDGVVAELARRVEDINRGGGLWTRYMAGEKVRVVYGFVESLAEVVEEAKSPHERVRVLLEFMGRQIPAQVPYEKLWPVAGGEPLSEERSRSHRRTRGGGRWIRGFGPRQASGVLMAPEADQRTPSS